MPSMDVLPWVGSVNTVREERVIVCSSRLYGMRTAGILTFDLYYMCIAAIWPIQ